MTKVGIRDKEYGGTTGGSSTAYTLAISLFGALEDLKSFNVKFHVTNGVSATLNINGIGAKALVDQNNTALPTSLFDADGIYTFAYNVTNDNFCYLNATTSQISGTSTPSAGLTVSEIAGENITTGDALFKGFIRETITHSPGATGSFNLTQATPLTVGQSVPVSTQPRILHGVTFNLSFNGTFGGGTATAYVYAAGGTLGNFFITGGILATSTNTQVSTASGNFTFYFNGFRLDPNVDYIVAINSVFVNGSQTLDVNYENPGTLALSNACDGATAYPTRDLLIEINMSIAREYVYKTNTTNIEKSLFYGFALDTVTTGSSIRVQRSGLYTTAGLTAGADYYITNANGVIGTSAGTVNCLIGWALSTTELLIETVIGITGLSGGTNYYLSSGSIIEGLCTNAGGGGPVIELNILGDYQLVSTIKKGSFGGIASASSGETFSTTSLLQSGNFCRVTANNGVSGELVNTIRIYPYK